MPNRTLEQVFGFQVDRNAELGIVAAQLNAASVTICRELVETAIACRIYDAHVTAPDEHSCLGCNLHEANSELGAFLAAELPSVSPLTRLHLTLNLINVVWERISDVCTALEFPKGLWSDNDGMFRSFKVTRRWANFMKHPGFFGVGIHHPIFVAGGSSAADQALLADGKRSKSDPREWILIDSQFVKEHWSASPDGSKLRAKLAEPFTACVILPNLEELAPLICSEFADFVKRMTEPTWVELARKHSIADATCDWWSPEPGRPPQR